MVQNKTSRWWWIVGIIIVISTAVFISMQVVNGQKQVNNSTVGKSMVDKLIEDTKKSMEDDKIIQDLEESYREELINKIENSTCDEGMGKPLWDMTKERSVSDLEQALELCIITGKIK